MASDRSAAPRQLAGPPYPVDEQDAAVPPRIAVPPQAAVPPRIAVPPEPAVAPEAAVPRPEGAELEKLLSAMPKAELHLHLDGALRIETALDLAATRGLDAPRTARGMRAALVAPEHGASQAALLRAFDLPVLLLQDRDALERAARELVEDKAADRVRYLELRWAPALHTQRGLRIDEVIGAVCAGAGAGAAATGSTARIICTAMRSHEPTANVRLAEVAGRWRGHGLTGFDLAGPEEAYPDAAAHGAAIEAARAAGLSITIHAGEWGGADQVRAALALDPARIAHGPCAVDDPALCAALRDRGVTLDLCPTSNVQAGIVPSVADHPLAVLLRRGVPVTLSVDDPTVADVALSEEYRRAVVEIGLSLVELWSVDRHALDVAFADAATLTPLHAEFDAWAATMPALEGRGQVGNEAGADA